MATILLVDDEKPLRAFLAEALKHAGHRVLQASHGRHALTVIAASGQDQPDLVISDVMMPIVGGVELCSILKADLATAGISVVLMSAAVVGASMVACADGYISKPFDLDALDALIDQLLSIRRGAVALLKTVPQLLAGETTSTAPPQEVT